MQLRRRWGTGLVAGLVASAVFGVAPAQARSARISVPPIPLTTAGTPTSIPPVVAGLPGLGGASSRAGVTWSERGRANVDIDIDRHHGQVTVR
jgi:hypothetical protein